jgi:hypothetical protein
MFEIAFACFLMTAAVLSNTLTSGAQQGSKSKKKSTTIVGRVTARVVDDMHLTLLDDHPENFSVFVVSLESKGHNNQPAKLVRVTYSYFSDVQSLPESFFDYSVRYRFRVVRDPSCDEIVTDLRDADAGTLPGLAAYIRSTRGAPDLVWDSRVPLDCYLLSPGKYKVQK